MDLDDYQKKWQEHDETLDKYIKFNTKQLEAMNLNSARSELDDFLRTPMLGLLIGLALQVFLVFFILSHLAMPQFVAAALLINAFVVFQMVVSAYQVSVIRRIHLDLPVTLIQKKLGALALNRAQYLTVTRFAYPLLWVPVLLVALKALFNVNLFLYLEHWWILLQMIIGIVCLGFGVWLSRQYLSQKKTSPRLIKLMDNLSRNDITGKNLKQAISSLNSVKRFEQET